MLLLLLLMGRGRFVWPEFREMVSRSLNLKTERRSSALFRRRTGHAPATAVLVEDVTRKLSALATERGKGSSRAVEMESFDFDDFVCLCCLLKKTCF